MARALLIALLCAGCSALDDRITVAQCTSDAECAPLDDASEPCLVHRCDAVSERCVASVPDRDGDGDAAAECGGDDCDDADPRRSPSATEVCNGVDDDCNGLLDGPGEDDDADGHADTCAGAAASDCDDDDASTFVGAPELCDRVDNDCVLEGELRLGGGRRREPSEDRDGDDHAALDGACTGGLLPQDDCDDDNPLVHLGAGEVCDGLDNDCDGTPDDASGVEGVDPLARGAICVPTQLAAHDHGCAVLRDGRVVCWGEGGGELGEERRIDPSNPSSALLTNLALEVEDLGPVRQITAGAEFTCARTETNEVVCWGTDLAHGIDRNYDPRNEIRFGRLVVPGVPTAIDVDAGPQSVCAVGEDGRVYCWGWGFYGTLGPDRGGGPEVLFAAAPVTGVSDAVQVSVSNGGACARLRDGRVACWGFNLSGALGVPDTSARASIVAGIDDAIDVTTGGGFIDGFGCAARADGTVSCWGYNGNGEVGCGGCPTTPRFAPTRVVGLTGVRKVRAGTAHACALTDAGAIWCWGSNAQGQLGHEPAPSGVERAPVRATFTGAIDLEVGHQHTCAVGLDESRCWGAGARFQLGDARPAPLPSQGYFWAQPRRISVLAHPIEIAGNDWGSCFRLPNDDVRCVGSSFDFGESERSTLGELRWSEVADMAGSANAFCVALRDGTVQCRAEGYAVVDEGFDMLTDVVQVAVGWRDGTHIAGDGHACALHGDGRVSCWGDHGNGQLGAGMLPASGADRHAAVAVVGLTDAVQITAGQAHSCALKRDGNIVCWGANTAGQLGARPLIDSNVPLVVEGLPEIGVRAVVAGGDTTCALLSGGEVWCWGASIGGGPVGPAPTEVTGLGIVSELVLGGGGDIGREVSACARLTSGQVRCWGANDFGQLGAGSAAARSRLPLDVVGLTDAVTIGAGDTHFCAVRRSGQAVCWGNGAGSRLGVQGLTSQRVPIAVPSLLGL